MSDESIYQLQHFGQKMGLGTKLGLLIVDFTNGFNDPAIFGGGNIDAAVKNTVPLLEMARRHKLPIAHTRIVFAEDGSDHGIHCLKAPRLTELTEDNPSSHFVPELTPARGEIVIRKRLPSAFFGTDLHNILYAQKVDTLLIAGCTTSGCVRASTLDAFCHGFRPMVVRDCVGDRAIGPHNASLFDMEKKYADVLSLDEALAAINSLAARQAA